MCISLTAVAATFSGCTGDRYSRSTGQYIDDKTLAIRVNSALNGNSEYKLGSVDVKAFRGNVQLSGFVDTQEGKQKAGEIAQNVEGVKSVQNNITVKDNLSQNP